MRCAYGANNPSPYGGITRIKSSVEVLRLPLSLSAPVRLCSHLRAPVRQKAVCSSQKVAFSFSLSQNTTPVYACVYPFSGVSVQKPLCQSGKRQVCPEPLRLLLLCVGLGIPASSDYSHTDAEPIVCVGMGILKPGGYSRTYVNLGVCVGMGIVGLGRYSRTYAIPGVCVVLGMLKPCRYLHADGVTVFASAWVYLSPAGIPVCTQWLVSASVWAYRRPVIIPIPTQNPLFASV